MARLLILSLGCGFAGDLFSAESTALAQNSPFSPAGKPGAVAAPDELYEFAGVSTIGQDTTVNIFQKSLKKGRWIPVGAKVDGITVARYDAAREQVVIRVEGGTEKVLALRKPSLAASKTGNLPSPPLPAGITVPGIPVAPTQPLPAPLPAPVSTVGSDPTGNAASPAPAPTTAPPPAPAAVPGTVAHQEQEARMLVSDLLEIGMAQRKAYEEAQAKAAQPNGATQPGAPAPAPAPPSPPPPTGPAQP